MNAAAVDAALPPRALLFGNPERTNPQLSPDGKRLAFMAPDAADVLQLVVRTLGATDDRVVTQATRSISKFVWAEDNATLLFEQDTNGDENVHVFALDIDAGELKDLTPWPGARSTLLPTNVRDPKHVLVASNQRDKKLFDVWRVDVKTAEAKLDTKNPGDVTQWFADAAFVVRAAMAVTKEGGSELRTRENAKAPFKPLVTVGLEDTLRFHGFTFDGRAVQLSTTVSSPTERIIEKSLRTGAERILAQSPSTDVLEVLWHPTRFVVQVVAFDVGGRAVWSPAVDTSPIPELQALGQQFQADVSVVSRDRADTMWLVRLTRDTKPRAFVLWNRQSKTATPLFSTQPKLDAFTFSVMEPVSFTARDGVALSGYLSLPPSVPPKALPLVMLVHGGPMTRDTWGFQSEVQWLTTRGYAVLQVNFRGSTGYGKRFTALGVRQWGRAMLDDVVDGARWLVGRGIADAKRVGIMGASFGGYTTLAGLAFSPDTFACGVDVVGPSNLFTLLQSTPSYWEAQRRALYRRVGDPTLKGDRDLLTKASPLFSADQVRAPVLIAHGANDPRVKTAEAEQFVTALEKNGQAATYVLYSDEGHGLSRPANRLDFYGRAETFLSQCLRGNLEPTLATGITGTTAVERIIKKRNTP